MSTTTRVRRRRLLAAAAAFLLSFQPARAQFQAMQIEQVIGGVNGDTSVQAIQLRMRMGGQNLVSGARLRVFDATGANPILLVDMTTNVSSAVAGRCVLIASTNFLSHVNPTISPDFMMAATIPASYLSSGSLVYESDTGTVYWRLSWGGASYTGPGSVSTVNDANGDANPPYPGPLPASGTQALQFPGPFSAPSTSNTADYALTASDAAAGDEFERSTLRAAQMRGLPAGGAV